jgi:hypothetical protein
VAVARVDSQGESASAAAVLASPTCPACARGILHRSRSRNIYERMRKSHSWKRLHRCEACGWRGWLLPIEFGGPPLPDQAGGVDFADLDISLQLSEAVRAPTMDIGKP